jgi:hypothetical protein
MNIVKKAKLSRFISNPFIFIVGDIKLDDHRTLGYKNTEEK